MISQLHIDYIRAELARGVAEIDIAQALKSQGLSAIELHEAFETARSAAGALPPKAPVASVQQPASVTAPVAQQTPSSKKSVSPLTIAKIAAAVVLPVVLGAGLVFAYQENWLPFRPAPYSEGNLLTGLLQKSASITSATYAVSGSLAVEPRDEDAAPFTLNESPEALERYANDVKRINSVSGTLTALDDVSVYPATLDSIVTAVSGRPSYSYELSGIDPTTGARYGYRTTNNGDNFELVVTFETAAATQAIRSSYNFDPAITKIDGQTVTFTKSDYSYFRMPREPKKPFLVALGELSRQLPAALNASLTMEAATDFKEEDPNFNVMIDATGDLGDLTYKINVEARKVADLYYFRINNLPSLFSGSIDAIKGTWLAVDPAVVGEDNRYGFGRLSALNTQLPEMEEEYKKRREAFTAFLRDAATIADEEKVIRFASRPRVETKDGERLFRYDLAVRKEAVLPFYKRLAEAAQKHEEIKNLELFTDPGLIAYLETEEFSTTFDYLDDNTDLIVWVDGSGYLAGMEYHMRLVPPDTATQLAGKQAKLVFSLMLNDINDPLNIEAPESSRPLLEVMEELQANALGTARGAGADASMRSQIMALRAQAEVYYDAHSGYQTGSTAFAGMTPTACSTNATGFLSDSKTGGPIATQIARSTISVHCGIGANGTSWYYAATFPSSAGSRHFCADSTGAAKESSGTLAASHTTSSCTP